MDDRFTFEDQLRFELEDRLADLGTKTHVSLRWEPGSGICRVDVMVHEYNWDVRERAIAALLAFEDAHADDVAVEFDVLPLEAATTVGFAHA